MRIIALGHDAEPDSYLAWLLEEDDAGNFIKVAGHQNIKRLGPKDQVAAQLDDLIQDWGVDELRGEAVQDVAEGRLRGKAQTP